MLWGIFGTFTPFFVWFLHVTLAEWILKKLVRANKDIFQIIIDAFSVLWDSKMAKME